jgi:hypothetical protein
VEGRQPAFGLLGEDSDMSRPRHALALVVLVLVSALAACSSGDPGSTPKPEPNVSVSSAPPAPASPKVSSCHRLSFTAAAEPVDTSAPVPCGSTHTSVTTKVGQLAPLVDGHLLAVDARTVQAKLAKACPPTLGPYVGGDQSTQRLSRFKIVWFSPTVEQADAGANWFRCDVVGLRSDDRLLTLPAKMKNVLDAPGALDRFGTCGTTDPAARGFAAVACSVRHTWRAVDVIDLPVDARYLDKAASAQAESACKGTASDRANGALKFEYSFVWPARAEWAAGQRYG